MRWILPLIGLLTLSCLPPHSEPIDPVPEIYLDFPELAQWGNVVFVGGREYWRPDRAHSVLIPPVRRAAPPHDAWMPYGNGYFYEDALDGLVWVSYDPWGFITTHYGYWRHHEQLGYLWRPLYPLTWRPFVATILHDERGFYFGICPFSMLVWDSGLYDLGFGFDDAYWSPYWNRVEDHGFFAYHQPRFDGYSVSVTYYDADVHWRDAPESHSHRDRDYRQRRHRNSQPGRDAKDGEAGGREMGDRSRPPREDPTHPGIVGTGLPARPVSSPPSPERSGDDSSPPAPAGLPTIPPRDLQPRREREPDANRPPLPIDTGELRLVTTPQPAQPGTSPPPAGPAAEPALQPERQEPRRADPVKRALPTIQPVQEPPTGLEPSPTTAPAQPVRSTPTAQPARSSPTAQPARSTPAAQPARLVGDSVNIQVPESASPRQPDVKKQPAKDQKEAKAETESKGKAESAAKERAKKALDARSKEKKRG